MCLAACVSEYILMVVLEMEEVGFDRTICERRKHRFVDSNVYDSVCVYATMDDD